MTFFRIFTNSNGTPKQKINVYSYNQKVSSLGLDHASLENIRKNCLNCFKFVA